ncbi:MAG: hypothetical protein IJX17_01015 [Clostridia bacterium]|nr:hypothetical protein [Clostridia bacterium]
MNNIITNYLREKGLKTSLLGFDYLSTIIERVIRHGCTPKFLVDEYCRLAILYGTTYANVEFAIRYCIGQVYDKYPAKKFIYDSAMDITSLI